MFIINNKRPNFLATGLTNHFFWPNALFPRKRKTTTQQQEKKSLSFRKLRKTIGYWDSSLRDAWRHRPGRGVLGSAVLSLQVNIRALPSIFITDFRFSTETLWGLEQQQSHHTVFKTSSFKSKLLKKKKKIQFLIWVSYRDPIAHTRRLHGLQMVASPLGSSSVGVCFQYSKGSTSSIINTSKSDLTIKINIQKNLSVHTSERISNTFTQKNNIIKDLFT